MKLVLGSKSPRRKQLLGELGYSFEIRTKDTDESFPDDLHYSLVPEHIAKLKAEALLSELKEDELLITADTIVVLDNEVIGKPTSRENAIELLNKLSGRTHQVISGIWVGTPSKHISKSVTTSVTFVALSQEEIEHYIDTHQPFDKAGSYGVQDWIGLIGVKSIEGSYNNVVGLPTVETREMIQQF